MDKICRKIWFAFDRITHHFTQFNLKKSGRTAITAYDITYGFSDQYIVEIDVLYKIAAESGLYSDEKVFTKFQSSDLATVSVNLFKGK